MDRQSSASTEPHSAVLQTCTAQAVCSWPGPEQAMHDIAWREHHVIEDLYAQRSADE